MYDLDELLEGNNVTDKWGADLIYSLCQGNWNQFKTTILHKEVFSNPIYLKRLRESAKDNNINSKEDILEVLNDFEIFLREPSNVKKLVHPLLNSSSFEDALSNLFSTDYLPDEILMLQKKKEDFEKLCCFNDKDSGQVLLQDFMSLMPESAATVVREEWHMKDDEDTELIFLHYFYHQAKENSKFFERMTEKVRKGTTLENAVIKHFKNHYVEKGKELITKKNERTELMTDENKRRLYFSLLGDDGRRESYILKDLERKTNKIISDEVKKIFCHLLYPKYCIVLEKENHSLSRRKRKEVLRFPNKEMEEEVLKQIADKEAFLKKSLGEYLNSEQGKRFILDYYFDEEFTTWLSKFIKKYVEAKARIDEFLNDEMALYHYLSQDTEFWPTLKKLGEKFKITGRVAFVEKGEKSKGKNEPQLMLQEDDIRDKFYEYFHEEVDFQGRKVHRFIRDFSCFHYDGSLSGWMNTTCFRFLLRYKVALEIEWRTKPFDPNGNCVKRFWKLLNDYEKELKTNKNALRLEDCEKSKKGKGLPAAKYLRNWLDKHGFDTIEEVLALLPTKEIIPNQDIVINSVLVNHAWKFFGFKKQNFENVDIMRKSIEDMEAKGEDWRFFDTSIVNVSSEDLIDVSTLKAEQVRVLPRLVAICHVINERNNEKGKKTVLVDEKTTYDELGKFYGVKGKTVKTWTSRGGDELVERVGSLLQVFRDELKNEIESKLKNKTKEQKDLVEPILDKVVEDILGHIPAILYEISSLFNKEKGRDCLQMNRDSLDDDDKRLEYKDGRNLAWYIAEKVTSGIDGIMAFFDKEYSDNKMPTLKDRDAYANHMVNVVLISLDDIKKMIVKKLEKRK